MPRCFQEQEWNNPLKSLFFPFEQSCELDCSDIKDNIGYNSFSFT